MARKVMVTLVDDLDGTELGDRGETVAFGVGGERYEIDLSPDNANAFKDMLGRYVSAARNVTRQPGSRRGHATGSRRSGMDREQSLAIRTWAKNNGWPDLADRGRIPSDVVDAYHSNTPRPTIPGTEPKREVPSKPVNDTAKTDKPAPKADRKSQSAEKDSAKEKTPAAV